MPYVSTSESDIRSNSLIGYWANCLLAFDKRILLGKPMQILKETDEIEKGQNTKNTYSYRVHCTIVDRLPKPIK